MAKSFKKVIACLLAVLMVTFTMPFSALAASQAGTWAPDMQIQFGVISDENGEGTYVTSGDPTEETEVSTQANMAINESGVALTGPMLAPTATINSTTGVYTVSKLTLEESDVDGTALGNDAGLDMNGNGGDYDLKPGDVITVTVTQHNAMPTIAATESAIAFSSNLVPAGFYREGSKKANKVVYVGTDYDRATESQEYVGFNEPLGDYSGSSIYPGINTTQDDSGIRVGEDGQSYMWVSTVFQGDSNDISAVADSTSAGYSYDDGRLGNNYAGTLVQETFMFMIMDDQPFSFWVYDTDNSKKGDFSLGCYAAASDDESDPWELTTYAINTVKTGVENPGSAKVTFFGTNVNKGSTTPTDPCADGHDFTVEITPAKAGTCSTKGKTAVMGCSREGCDARTGGEDTDYDANNHIYNDGVHTDATCVSNGYTTYTCTENSAHTKVEYDNPATSADHVWGAWVSNNDAACGVDGTKTRHCTVEGCTAEETDTDEGSALSHINGAPVEENRVEATCYSEGSYDEVVYCTRPGCGAEVSRETKTINKIAHTPGEAVQENVVPATCYSEGSYDEVVYCSVAACGAEISRTPKTLNKIAHTPGTPVRENEIAPTEDEDGSYDEVVYCTVAACGAEISRENKVDPALGHTHTYDEGVYTAPTCTEDGYWTYTCVKGDDTRIEYVENSKLNHAPAAAVQENVVDATCYSEGSYDEVVYCSREGCGAELSREAKTIGKIAHTPGEAVEENVVPASCDKEGSYDEVVYCTVEACKAEISREAKTIAKIAHTPVSANNAIAPTVDTEGKEADTVCKVCGATLEEGATIAKLPSVIVTIADTYASYGSVAGLEVGDNKVQTGSTVALTAEAAGGCNFVGWQVNKTIVSTEAAYTFTAYQDVTVTPVFVDTEAENETITVVFYDCYMNVTAHYTMTPADFQAEMLKGIPQGSQYAGKEFKGWSMSDEDILALDKSATITAKYDNRTLGYTVTTVAPAQFADGSTVMTDVPYDKSVTVTAAGADAWEIDGTIVAYGDTYTFYVGSNVTVTPVFDNTVTAAPTVAMVDVSRVTDSHKVAFLATKSDEGFKVIDHGFVYGKNATAAELVLGNVGNTIAASGAKVKSASITTSASDQFALNYGLTGKVGTVTAVAYVTYMNGTDIVTVYSALGSYTY